MKLGKRFSQSVIIIVLLIQLIIGTPFTISVADELLQSEHIIETITPTENTVTAETIVTDFPIIEVSAESQSISGSLPQTSTSGTLLSQDITIDTGVINTGILHTDITSTGIINTGITPSITDTGYTVALPVVSTIKPHKEYIITGGLVDPSSIDSYDVTSNQEHTTFCSYITYLNLKHILTGQDESLFARGDAITIWENLQSQNTTHQTPETVFYNTDTSGLQFLSYLDTAYTTHGYSIFDIVTKKPKADNDPATGLSLHQSHRFVVFLGSDTQRYVLDPVRTLSSDPLLLSTYLKKHIFTAEDLKIVKSYTLGSIPPVNEYQSGILIRSSAEFLPYVLQGLITAPNPTDQITNEVVFHTGFRYENFDGSLSAQIPVGLKIKTADGQAFNPFNFAIEEVQESSGFLENNYNNTFQFGISGQHLLFSHPIRLTVQTPNSKDGTLLDLLVQHEGQDRNRQGLTDRADSVCQTDGSVLSDRQISNVHVSSGTAVFYTCGASTFIVDDIGLVPAAIYGLRKLNSTYTGSLIKVRRSSDNTEQDIGFTNSGDLNTGTLMTFVGVGNAFVSVWYDQSGNGRNLTQTVVGNQPRIVNGGVLDTINNGKPGIRWFDTNGSRLLQTAAAPFGSADELTLILVHKEIVRQVNVAWILANDGQGIGRIFSHIPWSDGNLYFDVGGCCNSPQRLAGAYPFAIGTTNTLTYTNSVSNNTKAVYGNGNMFLSGPAAAGTIVQLRIGSDGSIAINGMISEFMIFNSVISTTQRKIIEQSQALYYGISGTGYIPESPTTLTGTSSNGKVALSWIAPVYTGGSALIDYQIEYKLNSSSTGWTIFADGISTSTTGIVTGLVNGLMYDFRVSAINANGTSVPSPITSAMPQVMSGMQLWLRSDTGVVASAGKVSNWIDQSGKGNTTTQSNTANQPSLVTNAINFNPSISFSQAAATRLEGIFSSRFTGTDITAFTIALPRSSSQDWAGMFTMWNSTGTNLDHNSQEGGVLFHRYSTTTQLGSERQVHYNTPANMLDKVSVLSSQYGGGSVRLRSNGASTYSGTTTNGSFNANRYAIGSRYVGSYAYFLDGYVAETLVFNSVLSNTDQNKVESYLSIKYGLTLDQTTVGGQNYTLSNNTTSRSTGSALNYNKNIAGISRDDEYNLLQKKSQSINSTSDIIVEATGSLTNLASLVRAHDGTSTGWINSDIPTLGINTRLQREWLFQEKNSDVGTVTITYPVATGSLSAGTLAMVLDTDGDFTNGGTSIISGTIINGYWTYTTNIPNNTYMTFGIISNGNICIQGPDNFTLGAVSAMSTNQIIDVQSSYFSVDDQKGSNSGYYTTLSISSLTGPNNTTISTAGLQIKADPIVTLSGNNNSSVILNTALSSYVSAGSPIQFIKRNLGSGANIGGSYGSRIWLRTNIPAYQSIGTYTGTITYTLYEN